MKFFVTKDLHVQFDKIPPLGAEWLKDIPKTIELGRESELVESRLFPSPTQGPETEICDDWKAHVQPDLHDWFQSASSLVSEDVKAMKKKTSYFSLNFPTAHIDGWLNALNQARLALATLYNLEEEDLNRSPMLSEDPERTMVILKVDFYALIQQCLLEHLEQEDGIV